MIDFTCRLCRLGRGTTVPGEGPDNPKVIVIADHPGPLENKARRPMVGDAGQLIRKALTHVVGLNVATDVYFTYAIKCMPPKKPDNKLETIGPREIVLCKKWMDKDLTRVKAPLIVLAGDDARAMLLPHVTDGISQIHGTVHKDNLRGWRYFLTWNPTYVQQYSSLNPDGSRQMPPLSIPWLFMKDMQKLKLILEEG